MKLFYHMCRCNPWPIAVYSGRWGMIAIGNVWTQCKEARHVASCLQNWNWSRSLNTKKHKNGSYYSHLPFALTLLHGGPLTQSSFCTEKPLHKAAFYTEKLLHREAFPHSNFNTHTHRSIYTQKCWHTQRRLYTEKLLHYTEQLLHTVAFMQKRVYTQALNTQMLWEAFTEDLLHIEVCTSHRNRLRQRRLTQKLSHTAAFTHTIFTHTNVYPQKPSRIETFPLRCLSESGVYREKPLHKAAFTRCKSQGWHLTLQNWKFIPYHFSHSAFVSCDRVASDVA